MSDIEERRDSREEVSHTDIYLRLGEMMGKIDSLQTDFGAKAEDIRVTAARLSDMDKKVSIAVAASSGAAALILILVPVIGPYLLGVLGEPALTQEERLIIKEELKEIRSKELGHTHPKENDYKERQRDLFSK
jgi:hypothetical protein